MNYLFKNRRVIAFILALLCFLSFDFALLAEDISSEIYESTLEPGPSEETDSPEEEEPEEKIISEVISSEIQEEPEASEEPAVSEEPATSEEPVEEPGIEEKTEEEVKEEVETVKEDVKEVFLEDDNTDDSKKNEENKSGEVSEVVSSEIKEEDPEKEPEADPSKSGEGEQEPESGTKAGEGESSVAYTVTFKVDGETYATVPVEEGSSLGSDMPSNPSKTGYRFKGWGDFTSETVVTEDTTVTAEFVKTWTVTAYNRTAELLGTYTVDDGASFDLPSKTLIARDDYTAYWAYGHIVADGQNGKWTVDSRITTDSITVSADTIIGPDYDQINYTITFYQEDKSTVVTTKTVNSDTSYSLNDIPSVPTKSGYSGKWVYAGGDFSNQVTVTDDMDVWAEYDQTKFTVTFIVEGNTYQTDKYNKGDSLKLPGDPAVEGKDFDGWFIGDTEYVGGETVNSDLTITAKLHDKNAVVFVILGDDGTTVEETLSQYFRSTGEAIGTMPQDPFRSGKVFVRWYNEDTGDDVTAETVVNSSFRAIAEFRTITVYNITAEYYYVNDSGNEVIFNTDLLQVEAHELPYTITAPTTTQTDPNQVAGGPIYYPETPTLTIEQSQFNDHQVKVRFKYVKYTAEYDFVYMLKDLEGDGYTEIPNSKEHVHGVLNSYVTPTVKTFDYAVLEIAQGATITQASGQELIVKYTRKNYALTYETNGGSYVGGVTRPYGSTVALSGTIPTRDGYTFEGWYTDRELTQHAGNEITITDNTTIYAKWIGKTVNYTIVYMFEKFNDAGTESSYVYDNSETGTGVVGTTVYANSSSIPDKTKKGWEKDNDKNATSSVVITADGSAVLIVYYKLRTYTFTFTIHNSSTNGRYRMTIKETTYRADRNTKYSFTAKLGQDISADWPINGGNATIWDNNNGYYFYYWSCQGILYASKILRVTEELLPNTGTAVAVTGYWRNNNNTVQVNYYLQNADNDQYTLSELYSQTAPSGNYNPKEIAGYTYDHSNNTTDWWGNVTEYNFYYNRHTYQIEYYHGTDKLKTISGVKYDATITGSTYNWTPTQAECGVDSDYTWVGWFDNAGCEGDPYTFSKMPAGASNGSVALVLYAKWQAPSYNVSFVDADDTSVQVADTQSVEKYQKASKPSNPTKDGYIFDGWYSSATGTDLYDWNTQITSNTTVYAHWSRKTLSYTVHYVDEDGVAVSEDKIVSNPNFVVGQNVTEQAIAVAGYRPNENSQTITLAADNNEITFFYSEKASTTAYTVRYILDPEEYPGNIAVASEKSVDNVPGDTASVIELAKGVDYDALYDAHPELEGLEFFPDEVEKTLVLTSSANSNVLYFYYSTYKHADVTVHFVDMAGNEIATDHTETLKVGKTFTLSRTPISGWDLNKVVVGTSYSGETAGTDYKITEATTANGLEFTIFYQKKLTITVADLSKQYDGTALTLPASLADQVEVEGLSDGDSLDSLTYSYANTDSADGKGRLNAGTATVTPSAAVISGTHANDSDYYSIKYISGTLEVTKINVTIRIEPDRWTGNTYDGTVYKTGFTNGSKGVADYILISHEGYKEQYLDSIWAKINAQATYDSSAPGLGYYVIAKSDAGDYTYELSLTQSDLPDNSNYSVSIFIRPGRLEIKPAALTIETGSAQKDYDGTPLTEDEVTVTGLIEADQGKVTVIVNGSITNPGSTDNTYTIDWGTVLSSNYTVSQVLGTLTVNKATLTITVNNRELPYNGSEQMGYTLPENINGTGNTITEEGYTITGLADGDTVTGYAYVAAHGTDVNTYSNSSYADSITITNSNDEDVTDYYDINFNKGELNITKKTVTITINGSSDTKVYNGSAQTSETEV
nr:InlB B-repeat-containing protein [Clostridia bacterium]